MQDAIKGNEDAIQSKPLWVDPEITEMEIADHTRGGGIQNSPPEGPSYKPTS